MSACAGTGAGERVKTDSVVVTSRSWVSTAQLAPLLKARPAGAGRTKAQPSATEATAAPILNARSSRLARFARILVAYLISPSSLGRAPTNGELGRNAKHEAGVCCGSSPSAGGSMARGGAGYHK